MRIFLAKIFKPLIDICFKLAVYLVGLLYKYDSYRRYYVLETVARIPYFSYLTCLHIYQTFGSKPALELMDLHYLENKNEEWHLMIVQELGGDSWWLDRCLARTIGLFYYFLNLILYILSPQSAYYLMQKVETEAVHSYTQLLRLKANEFKHISASQTATEYYLSKYPTKNIDLSKITLYQIFESIKEDEEIHVENMQKCEKLPSLFSNTPGIEFKVINN